MFLLFARLELFVLVLLSFGHWLPRAKLLLSCAFIAFLVLMEFGCVCSVIIFLNRMIRIEREGGHWRRPTRRAGRDGWSLMYQTQTVDRMGLHQGNKPEGK